MNEERMVQAMSWFFNLLDGKPTALPMAISKDYIFIWRYGISADEPSEAEGYRVEKMLAAYVRNDTTLAGVMIEEPVSFEDAILAMNGMKTL
jgi:hypothetical protein